MFEIWVITSLAHINWLAKNFSTGNDLISVFHQILTLVKGQVAPDYSGPHLALHLGSFLNGVLSKPLYTDGSLVVNKLLHLYLLEIACFMNAQCNTVLIQLYKVTKYMNCNFFVHENWKNNYSSLVCVQHVAAAYKVVI